MSTLAHPDPAADRSPARGPALPGALGVVAAAALWGTGGVVAAELLRRTALRPVGIGTWRLGIAAVVLLGLRVVRRAPLRVPRAVVPGVLGVGAGLAAYQALYFAAVADTGVAVATLIALGVAPVLVALGDAVALRERPSRAAVGALATALAGLALLVGRPGGAGAHPLLGAGLAALAGAGYAAVTLLSRALAPRVDAPRLTAAGFGVAALLLLPLGAASGLGVPGRDLGSWGLLVYLGVLPTAVAYGLLFAALHRVRATSASVLTLVEPLTATLLAALVLGERLRPAALLGGALVLAAVVVLVRHPGPGAAAPPVLP